MPLFAYRAMGSDGRLMRGRLEANNAADLEMRLRRMGFDYINGDTVRQRARFLAAEVPRRELINFCFHLEQLTRAGVPILESLTDLRDSLIHARFREVIAGLIESIHGGNTLSQAMRDHPRVFDDVFVSLIRAGEDTGNLADVLLSLVDSLKWQDELVSHTRKIVMYPIFLGTVTLAVTFFLMIYLVPKMAGFIRNMGQELPWQTRLLIGVSDFVGNHWLLLLSVPMFFCIFAYVAVRTNPAARYRYDHLKLSLPYVGNILRKIILARFANVFAMLYSSGISVIDAIRSTEKVVGNVVIQQGLEHVGQLISDGQNVTAAFQSIDMFPPLVIRMLRVGENTGGLDRALNNVSYFYNRDVRESIGRAQVLIEPALTLIVGLILGWVMISMLGPIYDIITKLKT